MVLLHFTFMRRIGIRPRRLYIWLIYSVNLLDVQKLACFTTDWLIFTGSSIAMTHVFIQISTIRNSYTQNSILLCWSSCHWNFCPALNQHDHVLVETNYPLDLMLLGEAISSWLILVVHWTWMTNILVFCRWWLQRLCEQGSQGLSDHHRFWFLP